MAHGKTTLLLAGLLIMAALSCAGAGDSAEGALPRREMGYTWTVKAAYPETGNEAADEAVRGWLERHVADHVAESGELASASPDFPVGEWTMQVEYTVTRPSRDVVSIVFSTCTYPSGAAHPLTTLDAVNCDLRNGALLHPADLFEDPEQAVAIMAEHAAGLIGESFRNRHPDQFPNGVEDGAWFAEGFRPTPENYSCLGLEAEGVRVYFQQYQILPYVFGSPNALIPLDLLAPAGPNPAIWPTPATDGAAR